MIQKEIVCPFCNSHQSDDHLYMQDSDMYAIAPGEEVASMVCEFCDKEFWVQGGYIPQYETFKNEDEIC